MEITIAGAGIAGLTLAILLKRQGCRVVMYDQLETPAPVGSGLIVQPTGQGVLERLELLDDAVQSGAVLTGLYGSSAQSGRAALDVSYEALRPGAFGLGMHRATLYSHLLSAAQKEGVAFEVGRRVVEIESDHASACLVFADGIRTARADVVIDAMGVKSPLARHGESFLDFGALWANVPWSACAGFPADLLSQKYSYADKMAGVLPIGYSPSGEKQAAFFWSLKAEDLHDWQEGGLDRWKDEVTTLWPEAQPVLETIMDREQIVFARYAHHTNGAPVSGRIVRVGDSWHAASPQLGQGANVAMLDATALATALEQHDDYDAAMLAYLKARHRHIQIYQSISALFTPFYQSTSRLLPLIRDVVGPRSSMPVARKILASMVAGELGLNLVSAHDTA